jgi:hypothetical protein
MKDNDLFDANFKLGEEVTHKENIITALQDEIVDLKRSILDQNQMNPGKQIKIVNNFVFEPDQDIIRVLNKETNAHKAIEENGRLMARIQELALSQSKLVDDLKQQQ